MRHPFYMDHLGRQDRSSVRRSLLRVFAAYISLAVILVGVTVVRAKVLVPSGGSMQQDANVR
jgi:hypothetical protein